MLINCAHDQVANLNPDVVNTATGLFLHRFNWLTDDVIGSLPVTWNYLEGWHTAAECADPIAVHFTRGGPWFEEWRGVEYGDEWREVAFHNDRNPFSNVVGRTANSIPQSSPNILGI